LLSSRPGGPTCCEDDELQVLVGLQLVEVCRFDRDTDHGARELRVLGGCGEDGTCALERVVAVLGLDGEGDVDRVGLKVLACAWPARNASSSASASAVSPVWSRVIVATYSMASVLSE